MEVKNILFGSLTISSEQIDSFALEIECSCQTNQPLRAAPSNPQTAIQLWSVIKQFTANRQELIDWLNQCWQLKSHK